MLLEHARGMKPFTKEVYKVIDDGMHARDGQSFKFQELDDDY